LKTKIIEITVSGRTGTGKSEVLEVIKRALQSFYNYPATHINIAGFNPDGAIVEAAETGQTAKAQNTVFVLYEQNISGEIKVYN
jgi:predicted ATP-binding protein involved in virulence